MLEEAVRDSLAGVSSETADAAARLLAITYARQIDEDGDLAKLGPALLNAAAP
jgi:hypothetical protein